MLALLAGAAVVVPALLPERSAEPGRDSPVDRAPSPTAALPSPTAPADLSALPIARQPFCDRLDERYVAEALGGRVDARTSYRPGDRVSLAPGTTDVAHEFGCTFKNEGAEARVWVFTAPVEESEAEAMVEELRAKRRCRYPDDALQYGTPGLVAVCPLPDDRTRVTLRGLYDETWLSCQLSVEGTAQEALTRTERWCLHVATTLGARP